MRWLYTLSRVAFICNLFFLVALSLQVSQWLSNGEVTATVLIIGFFLAALVNPLVNIIYLLLFTIRRKFWHIVPAWLFTANVLFLVIQIFYLAYLNGTPAH